MEDSETIINNNRELHLQLIEVRKKMEIELAIAKAKADKKQLKKNILDGHFNMVKKEEQISKMYGYYEISQTIIYLAKLISSLIPVITVLYSMFAIWM